MRCGLVIALLVTACATSPRRAVAPPPASVALVSVRWGEQSYELDDRRIKLTGGHWEMHEYMDEWQGAHDTQIYHLESVAYGDLDGDGKDEAVVLVRDIYYAPGQQGREIFWLFAFAVRAGAPVQIGCETAGDVPVRALAVTGGEITLVREPQVAFLPTRFRLVGGSELVGIGP